MTTETIWVGIGMLGQAVFFGRWLVQWIASEKNSESRFPIAFWYMSLIGGLMVLAYALYRRDLVFISGQVVGNIVYIRNLILIHRTDQSKNQPRPQA